MVAKFSDGAVPLRNMRTGPGRDVAAVRSVKGHRPVDEEQAFFRAVEVGLADIEAGRVVSPAEVRTARFALPRPLPQAGGEKVR